MSGIGRDLRVHSDARLDLHGAEGVTVDGRTMSMEAGQGIVMASQTGHIVLDGQVVLDPLALPVASGKASSYLLRQEKSQYKLCICSPSGQLFSVPASSDCDYQPIQDSHPCFVEDWTITAI